MSRDEGSAATPGRDFTLADRRTAALDRLREVVQRRRVKPTTDIESAALEVLEAFDGR